MTSKKLDTVLNRYSDEHRTTSSGSVETPFVQFSKGYRALKRTHDRMDRNYSEIDLSRVPHNKIYNAVTDLVHGHLASVTDIETLTPYERGLIGASAMISLNRINSRLRDDSISYEDALRTLALTGNLKSSSAVAKRIEQNIRHLREIAHQDADTYINTVEQYLQGM